MSDALFAYDRALGARYVCGADEAGRACWAGPLVAAAVRFDYDRLGFPETRAGSGAKQGRVTQDHPNPCSQDLPRP